MSYEPTPPLTPPTPESVAEEIQKKLSAEGLGPDNPKLTEFYEGIGWKKKPTEGKKGQTDIQSPNSSKPTDEDILDLSPPEVEIDDTPAQKEPFQQIRVADNAPPAPTPALANAPVPALEAVAEEALSIPVSQTGDSWKDYALGCLGLPLRPFRWAHNGISSWRARRAQERADRAARRTVEPASSGVTAQEHATEPARPNLLYRAASWCWEKKAIAGTIAAVALAIGTAYLLTRPSKPYQASLIFNKREWTLETVDYEKLDEKRMNKFIESYDSKTIDQKLLEADKADGVQDYKITKGIEMLK